MLARTSLACGARFYPLRKVFCLCRLVLASGSRRSACSEFLERRPKELGAGRIVRQKDGRVHAPAPRADVY